MIRVAQLTYRYSPERVISFNDFAVDTGAHALLLGESGSGKTTLLHLLGGLLRAQQGMVEINGTQLSSLGEVELDRFRGKNIGFVFQRNHLISALSVRKNLLLAPFLAGEKMDPSRVDEVLHQLGLTSHAHASVRQLSQGQAQRVAIARAVINRPAIILADEPTSALDDRNCDRVIELLLETSTAVKATLIVATHDHRLKSKIRNQILLS